MKDSYEISEPFFPLIRYAHEISIRLLNKINDIENNVETDTGELSELVLLGKNVHGQYVLFGERQLMIMNQPSEFSGPVFEDRFTSDKYMMTGTLEKGDLERYISIGKRKMPTFFNGQTASGSGRNHVTGFITVFIRYGDYIAENFLPVDLYEIGEKFARANQRWIDIYPEDLLRGNQKTLAPKRVNSKVAILWPSNRKEK